MEKKYIDNRSWNGCAMVPWQKTFEEAQADLDRLAKEKGWKEWLG